MSAATTSLAIAQPYVVLDEQGRPIVRETRFKVEVLVREHVKRGMSARDIHEAYPQLSLAAIHGALSYYYDHKGELDAEMERGDREAERTMREIDASETRTTRAELERRLREDEATR